MRQLERRPLGIERHVPLAGLERRVAEHGDRSHDGAAGQRGANHSLPEVRSVFHSVIPLSTYYNIL